MKGGVWDNNSRRVGERIVDKKHNRTDGKEGGNDELFQMQRQQLERY